MNNTMDHDKAVSLSFRRRDLDSRLNRIRDVITGRNVPFFPLISEDGKRISEKKLVGLIDTMLRGYSEYMRKLWDHETLPDDMMKLLRCYLYCAFLGISEYDYADSGVKGRTLVFPVSTFADISYIAHGLPVYRSPGALERAEAENSEVNVFGDGMFGLLDAAYEIVTGTDIADSIPAPERERFREELYSRWEREYDGSGGSGQRNEPPEGERSDPAKPVLPLYGMASDEEDGSVLPEDDITDDSAFESFLEYELVQEETVERNRQEWLSRLPENCGYAEIYHNFRRLYFELDAADELAGHIDGIIDAYMYSEGLSAFSFGERYGLLTERLDRLESRFGAFVEREAKEVKNR